MARFEDKGAACSRSCQWSCAAQQGRHETVYNLSDRFELFHKFPYEQFRNNLNRLRKTHQTLFSSTKSDYEALMRDRTLHPKKTVDNRGKPVWDESEAQFFLRQDRNAAREAMEQGMEPLSNEELYTSRSGLSTL